MSNFALNFRQFENITTNRLDTIVRKTSMDLYKDILNKSPVDTGRFRANNLMSIDFADNREVGVRNTSSQLGEANSKLSGRVAGRTVFIQNNLDYALKLEYGSSAQAPDGIYGTSILRFNRFLENAVNGSRE